VKLHLLRTASGKESTISSLFDVTDARRFLCFTLEDEYRAQKLYGETRIPAGAYRITLRSEGGFHLRYAKRFHAIHRGMLWIRDVPNFQWVLVHCGNRDEETAGCLLVGDGAVYDAIGGDHELLHSSPAYARIYPNIAAAAERDDCHIQIEDLA